MDAIQSQLMVKNKIEQLHDTVKELYAWEDDIKKANIANNQPPADAATEGTLPPIRSDVKAMGKFAEDKATVEKQDNPEGETVNKKQLADAEVLKDRGNKQCKLGNYQEAIALYGLAIETYGDSATYYSNRALCHMNLDQFDECFADCSIAIAKDPKYMKAYYRRMQAYERLGENEKAAAECRLILELSSDDNERNTAMRDLARIEKRLEGQKPASASPNKQTSAPLDPMQELIKLEADKYKELGNKQLARKEFEKAERCYTKAISLFGDEAIYYTNRSLCYWNLKDFDKCLADCNKAIQLDESYFRPYYRRMQVRELRGAYQSAVEDCRKFIELAKDDKQKATAEKDLMRLERLVKNEQPAKNAFVWSEIKKNAKLIKFVQKPPHMRSKKTLRRIPIKDVGPNSAAIVAQNQPSVAPSAPSKRAYIPDSIIDKIFNNNTGERLAEPETHKSPMLAGYTGHKLQKLFSPPATPTEQKKPFPTSNDSMIAVPVGLPGQAAPLAGSSSSGRVVEPKPKPTQQMPQNKVEKDKINQGNQDCNEKDNKNDSPGTAKPTRPNVALELPKSSPQFYTTWSGLDDGSRYEYLKMLRNTQLSRLFSVCLSNGMLSEILHILQKRFIPDQVEVTHIMKEIARNETISILSLMFDDNDRAAVDELLKYMETSGARKEDVKTVRGKLLP